MSFSNLLNVVLVGLALATTSQAAQDVKLPRISSQPTNASQVLDPRLASFSIEFSYMPTFGGNKTHPNVLTQELMQRLVERTGVGPDIRPGGITMCVIAILLKVKISLLTVFSFSDSSIYQPNASALELDMSDVRLINFTLSLKTINNLTQ